MACLPLSLPSTALASKKPHAKKVAGAKSFSYRDRKDAMAFADDLAERGGLDRAWLRRTMAQAHFIPAIQKQMRPAEHGFVKNWNVYRGRFIEPFRIQTGIDFWTTHAATLARAEKEYGVPPEVIVGIIGVETIYGRHMGSYRVIDALATLAFDFPKTAERDRSAFFRTELAQFLMQLYPRQLDTTSIKGSYAGAIGLGQFMPSGWAKYAVDFDGDGSIDLRDADDAIGSIANFLRSSNWHPGMPAYYPVSVDDARLNAEALLAPDILPTFSARELAAGGVLLDENAAQYQAPLALVKLLNGDPENEGSAPTYVLGTENFYAISRYNRSSYYTLAVIELGETIKAEITK
ncbi:membrane-bound lytic murein transglycosylase B precursor [mine drainage metagenome]|uniref:Membrane-bound lytic murein transglycosylase B n=1 Tax=mine drainage metagenome TaxID=410659 RepID=A0A1J5R0W3_9ZZZZ